MSDESFIVWVFALTLLACVLFRGEPDVVDGLRHRIYSYCPGEIER